MQFYEHRLTRTEVMKIYKRAGHRMSSEQFYRGAIAHCIAGGASGDANELILAREWEKDRKPYYLVYPGILAALLKIKLDLDGSLITPPMPVLSVRLPVKRPKGVLSFDWQGEPIVVQEILFGEIHIKPELGKGGVDLVPMDIARQSPAGLSVWLDIGECGLEGTPVKSYRNIFTVAGKTIESEIDDIHNDPKQSALRGIQVPEHIWKDAFRLVLTLCLLEKDPSIIEPDVLAKDQAAFDETGAQRYVDRARKHKLGWHIGRKLEVVPHYRRPHPFRVWTGPGRSIPKIVMRRGTIVHRDKVEKLPSGYQGIKSEADAL